MAVLEYITMLAGDLQLSRPFHPLCAQGWNPASREWGTRAAGRNTGPSPSPGCPLTRLVRRVGKPVRPVTPGPVTGCSRHSFYA